MSSLTNFSIYRERLVLPISSINSSINSIISLFNVTCDAIFFCSCVAKSTTDEFVVKSISIHGDRYDYSLVNYNHSKEKVKIICEKHGILFQSSSNPSNSFIYFIFILF